MDMANWSDSCQELDFQTKQPNEMQFMKRSISLYIQADIPNTSYYNFNLRFSMSFFALTLSLYHLLSL